MGLNKRFKRWRSAARVRRREATIAEAVARNAAAPGPPPVAPVWPLPRRPDGPSDDAVRAIFARFPEWHYPFEFAGELKFPLRYRSDMVHDADRHLQRFAHFMPALVAAAGGSLRGKRILDIACNAGFWATQCALLGAGEVVGFDARAELVEEANAIKDIIGVDNVTFQQLDFDELTPARLGTFDIVLNLGLLYHLPTTLEPLARTLAMTRHLVLLDTAIDPGAGAIVRLVWEEPIDVTTAHRAGVVAFPTRSSIELLLRHLRVDKWNEIPLRSLDMPPAYLDGRRASWLIEVTS